MQIKAALMLSTSLAACGAALAQAPAPAPAPYQISYNVGAVSDYRYRGLSQSAKRPALQGGVDLALANGFYLGAWGSTIRWIKDSDDPSLRGPVEIDVYGGYRGELAGLSYDVGGLQYWYPRNTLKSLTGENADTFELYGSLGFGPATVKYSHALTTLFGVPDSKNSGYLDLSASFDLGGGFSLVPHLGWQKIRNTGTYRDYSLAVAKEFAGVQFSGALVGTNWKDRFGAPATLVGSGNRDLGRAGLVLGVKAAF
jgi:uncharacterized protein (TIGR02001 family)